MVVVVAVVVRSWPPFSSLFQQHGRGSSWWADRTPVRGSRRRRSCFEATTQTTTVGAKAVDTVDDVTTAAATNDETTIFMGVMGWGRKGIQRRGCQSQTKADPRRGPVWFVFDVSCCWVCPCVIEILCVWRDLSMFGFCSLSQCVSPQRAVLIYC